MTNELMIQVKNSIFEVMETMFFLTLEQADTDSPPPPTDILASRGCSIPFTGTISGKIYFQVPLDLLELMAANFMGQSEEQLSTEEINGTLTEALNMIAGNALTRFNPDVYMGLGLPSIEPLPLQEAMDDTLVFLTQEGIMTAHIKLDD
ncbi:MAG: chemotaxis protein CheX [Desulfovibrionales bacterium]|nr:chemotaxis protein CheX [Desulfovibrionales bacterium]